MMKDLSAVERGTMGSNTRLSAFVRLWTTFYSYFNTKLNIAYETTKRVKRVRDVPRFISDVFMLFLLEALITEAILLRLPDFGDDEDEQDPLLWGTKLVGEQMMATLPGFREIAAGIRGFDASPGGIRGLSEIATAVRVTAAEGHDLLVGDDEFDEIKVIRALNAMGGVVFKYPSGQLDVALKATERSQKGEDVRPIDYLLNIPKENR